MMHRTLQYAPGWEWDMLYASAAEPVARNPFNEYKRKWPESAHWFDQCEGTPKNQVTASELEDLQPVVYGTIVFPGSAEEGDLEAFHFWIRQGHLITVHSSMRLPVRLERSPHDAQFARCATAPEAIYVILSAVLEPFHTGLDHFETKLARLESAMRRRNKRGLLDKIFEIRYELLRWSHLFIPVREVAGAMQEGFRKLPEDTESVQRFSSKLERIDILLKHYASEIDTLIAMDDAIANFRGNDIMKTLTIFTVLFTPATVAGALWGMNFNKIPWASTPAGFISMCAVIIFFTLAIYAWLWWKGWTGDLLKDNHSIQGGEEGNTGASISDKPRHNAKAGAPVGSRSRSSRGGSLQEASGGGQGAGNGAGQGQQPGHSEDSPPLTRSRRQGKGKGKGSSTPSKAAWDDQDTLRLSSLYPKPRPSKDAATPAAGDHASMRSRTSSEGDAAAESE